ncbi:hypothetical protein E5288_WYG019634 [Bos mutus]|uniref:Uncharacterized protein n=1 Tax=Bos mutus TaxID=72004 RepID=A0A6B0RVK4_9CETA|nr:hypothetical protein [Bos mutus]
MEDYAKVTKELEWYHSTQEDSGNILLEFRDMIKVIYIKTLLHSFTQHPLNKVDPGTVVSSSGTCTWLQKDLRERSKEIQQCQRSSIIEDKLARVQRLSMALIRVSSLSQCKPFCGESTLEFQGEKACGVTLTSLAPAGLSRGLTDQILHCDALSRVLMLTPLS